MKILFTGLGSIGQRHLRNIQKIIPNAEIYAHRHSSNNYIIKDETRYEVDNIAEYYGITILPSIESAVELKPDITFITNPTAFHISTARTFAEAGSNLFIEKPLSHTLENVEDLKKIISNKKLISLVGYQTRFNPLYRRIKEIAEKKKKDITGAFFEWNTYLPAHHPYENYSTGYAAREDLGGGVILCLSHELDLIYTLFGMPLSVIAVGGKLSKLEMTAEDSAMCILKYRQPNLLPVSLHLSFAQTKEQRRFKIQFSDETLEVDLLKNEYVLFDKKGNKKEEHQESTSRDNIFFNELSYFINCVQQGEDTCINVEEGEKRLYIALKIKESIKEGGIEKRL